MIRYLNYLGTVNPTAGVGAIVFSASFRFDTPLQIVDVKVGLLKDDGTINSIPLHQVDIGIAAGSVLPFAIPTIVVFNTVAAENNIMTWYGSSTIYVDRQISVKVDKGKAFTVEVTDLSNSVITDIDRVQVLIGLDIPDEFTGDFPAILYGAD